jgi:hypothetical protein
MIRQSYLKPNDDLKKKVEEHLTEQQTQAEEQVNFILYFISSINIYFSLLLLDSNIVYWNI